MKGKDKQDADFCFHGARTLLKYLNAMLGMIDGVRQNEDIECLHRMRVAARRLRSLLPLFNDCLPPKQRARWRKQLRRVTRALGRARDADVQIVCVQEALNACDDDRLRPGLGTPAAALPAAAAGHAGAARQHPGAPDRGSPDQPHGHGPALPARHQPVVRHPRIGASHLPPQPRRHHAAPANGAGHRRHHSRPRKQRRTARHAHHHQGACATPCRRSRRCTRTR